MQRAHQVTVVSAPETWGPVIEEGVKENRLRVLPYELTLGYEHWGYGKEE